MERDNFEISQELEQMREQFKVLTDKGGQKGWTVKIKSFPTIPSRGNCRCP